MDGSARRKKTRRHVNLLATIPLLCGSTNQHMVARGIMLTAVFDEDTGIVCTVAEGLASVEEFDSYVPAVTNFLAKSRARHGRSLHLVDAAQSPVQSKDLFEHVTRKSEQAVRVDDRCAVVLESTLARMQIDRMPQSFSRRFFTDRPSATAWLLEEALTKPSSPAGAA